MNKLHTIDLILAHDAEARVAFGLHQLIGMRCSRCDNWSMENVYHIESEETVNLLIVFRFNELTGLPS